MNQENKNSVLNLFKVTKDQWPFIFKLMMIAFVGIVILNFANFFYRSEAPKQAIPPGNNQRGLEETVGDMADDSMLERKLEKILSEMNGVGKVSVSVIFSEGPTKEYAVNVSTSAKEIQEKDQAGGVRTTSEKTENGQMVMVEGNQQPVLVKESMPKIQGVLVVAEGAEDPVVKEKLFKAVQTLLQVPAHRVTICPKNGG